MFYLKDPRWNFLLDDLGVQEYFWRRGILAWFFIRWKTPFLFEVQCCLAALVGWEVGMQAVSVAIATTMVCETMANLVAGMDYLNRFWFHAKISDQLQLGFVGTPSGYTKQLIHAFSQNHHLQANKNRQRKTIQVFFLFVMYCFHKLGGF